HALTTLTNRLPARTPKQEIDLQYTNNNGGTDGPLKARFDPTQESLKGTKQILKLTENSWLSFRDYDGKVLLYFSHLLSHRGSFTDIAYGLNRETPDQTFDFPAWDKPGNALITQDVNIYLTVPDETTFATVQVSYKDGTKSEIVRINR
ncbi:MAG: hypothetical protein AAGJ31_13975, partial [Verrucomicrobiota bacterium]